MVLMNAGKRARNAASITNNTKIFGIIGGLRPNVGKEAGVNSDRANSRTLASRGIRTVAQLKKAGLYARNCAGSGGVGKRVLMYYSR
jgi:hypothetical protein